MKIAKNNKGVTLISVIVYIIAMSLTIAIISHLTTFFYKNIDISELKTNYLSEYNRFNLMLLGETNKLNNEVVSLKTYEQNSKKISYIIFSSGNQYTFDETNKSIYLNKIKICENVDDCEFKYYVENSKKHVIIDFQNEKINFTGQNAINYVLQ